MRWPRTLWLYVLREIVSYTLVGLAAISVVMLTRSLVRVLDKLIGAGFLLGDLVSVVGLLGTMLLIYALPVSFLFGVLLAIGRMASDVEITAMRACGVGVGGLMLPVGLLGLALSGLTFHLTLDVEPEARQQMATAVRRMLVRGASVEPGRFNSVGERTLYVDERGPEGRLRGVVISDRSDPERPFLVFAETGSMALDDESSELVLRLEKGDVHLAPAEEDEDRYQRLRFESFEYKIDMRQALGTDRLRRPREMSVKELRGLVARIDAGEDPGPLREEPASYAMHLYQRYAMPAAPALFALVGVPLGMGRRRGARSWGVILCAVLAFGYYALHSFGELLAVESGLPAALAAWLPNIAFAVVGLALLANSRRGA